jgi:cell division protein FtsI (penicillin-binding protein 3)
MTNVREGEPVPATATRLQRRPTGRLPRGRFERRSLGLLVTYLLVVLVAAGRLVQVQVVRADAYAALGADQRDEFLTLPADRGRLYDRNGDVLAASVASVSVYADPRAFRVQPDGPPVAAQDLDEALAALAPVLDVPADVLRARLTTDASFVYLARQVDREVGGAVAALGLRGVGTVPEARRVYPGGSLAAQVLGLTDIDGAGIAGLELEHQEALAGQPGWLMFESSEDGFTIPTADRELQAAVPGNDLVLTLDRQVQHTAERVAAEVVERYGALGASIVVLEVGTGDVLAMASAPLVDLTDRGAIGDGALRNHAVTDVFEPGSVQKAITAAAALEEGLVTPETMLWVDDRIEVGGTTFRDSHDHPTEELSFAEVIETSSNVGTIMVAEQLGEQRLALWLERFGYGAPVGVDFPGESPGLLRDVDDWWGTSLPTIAIGQGVAVTLLQAANAYATIANDGVAVTPRVLRGQVGEDGRLVAAPEVGGERILSTATATQLRRILAGVVDGERGTGGAAAVEGHRVAGKTGTARKPAPTGGYVAGGHIATFVGMAPADAPELVVAVMVDEPETIWGGVVAAPAFAEVMAEALRRAQVPPAAAGTPLDEVLRTSVAEPAAGR